MAACMKVLIMAHTITATAPFVSCANPRQARLPPHLECPICPRPQTGHPHTRVQLLNTTDGGAVAERSTRTSLVMPDIHRAIRVMQALAACMWPALPLWASCSSWWVEHTCGQHWTARTTSFRLQVVLLQIYTGTFGLILYIIPYRTVAFHTLLSWHNLQTCQRAV
jgi:hypothetical protein